MSFGDRLASVQLRSGITARTAAEADATVPVGPAGAPPMPGIPATAPRGAMKLQLRGGPWPAAALLSALAAASALIAPGAAQSTCVPPLAADAYRQVRINGGSISAALQFAASQGYYDGSASCFSSLKALVRSDPATYGAIDSDFAK